MFSRQVNFVAFLCHRRKAPGSGMVWLVQSPGEVFSGPGIRADILSQLVCDPHKPLPGLFLKGHFWWSSWFSHLHFYKSLLLLETWGCLVSIPSISMLDFSFQHILLHFATEKRWEFPRDLTGGGWPIVSECNKKYLTSHSQLSVSSMSWQGELYKLGLFQPVVKFWVQVIGFFFLNSFYCEIHHV